MPAGPVFFIFPMSPFKERASNPEFELSPPPVAAGREKGGKPPSAEERNEEEAAQRYLAFIEDPLRDVTEKSALSPDEVERRRDFWLYTIWWMVVDPRTKNGEVRRKLEKVLWRWQWEGARGRRYLEQPHLRKFLSRFEEWARGEKHEI